MPELRMRNICKSFFGTYANRHVDLDVAEGEIHALLGENGAGKTTLMNILYGMYRKDEGTITLDDREVSFKSPKEAIGLRIGMVHQHFTLVPTLTVQQNITLGLRDAGYPFSRERVRCDHIESISELYGLQSDPRALVKDLSVGQMQRVEILKLLYRKARLLIFDEPTAVLTPQESDQLFRMFKQLKHEGCSIIVITHHIQEVLDHCDRVTVLRDGRSVATVETHASNARELSTLMIGRDVRPMERPSDGESKRGETLRLEQYQYKRTSGKTGVVDFTVRRSEILGIAGVDGNGQKELLESLMGLSAHVGGRMLLLGEDLSGTDTAHRRRAGISYISDDRHHDSLVLDMGIAENLMLRPSRKGGHHLIDRKRMMKEAGEALVSYGIKAQGLNEPMRLLSGGNQQKVVLAREFVGDPLLVIAFQPTRGLDIGATEFIHNRLLGMREAGCAILLVSTNLEEIFSLSDRIAVMHEGSIMEIMDNRSPDPTRIGLLMAGITPMEEAQ